MVFPLAVNAKAGDSDGARRDTRQRFICSPLDTLETASGGVIFSQWSPSLQLSVRLRS